MASEPNDVRVFESVTAIKMFVSWKWLHSNTSSNLVRKKSFNLSAYSDRTLPNLVVVCSKGES